MSRRITTLQDKNMGGNRNVDSNFDIIKIVADNIDVIVSSGSGMASMMKYLGASDDPPATRMGGTAIQDGDYYFDTSVGVHAITYYDLTDANWFVLDPAAVLANANLAEAARVASALSQTAAATSATSASGDSDQTALDRIATAADVLLAASSETNASTSASGAVTSASGAATSASSATSSASSATTSASGATSSASAAVTSATAAATSASGAVTSASGAATSASEAVTSASGAASSASAAVVSQNAAATSETNAGTFATNSSNSAGASATSAGASLASQNLAQKWAEEVEDTEVITGKFSSLHHAAKSAASAATATTQAGTATTQAGIATTQAGNASTSAGTATTQAGISTTQAGISTTQAGASATSATASEASNVAAALSAASALNASMGMSKSEFFAMADASKLSDPFSGFHNMGQHYSTSTEVVNDGMWENVITANQIRLGYEGDGGSASITNSPELFVEGALLRLSQVAVATEHRNYINLPPVCDGTKTYDSVTGAVTAHASAAVAFAFTLPLENSEAVVASLWTGNGTSLITSSDGNLTVDRNGGAFANQCTRSIPTISGEQYTFKCTLVSETNATDIVIDGTTTTAWSGSDIVFTATGSTVTVSIHAAQDINGVSVISNLSIGKPNESVITSRQDFAFLEVFYRRISKDGGTDGEMDAVFPLGNSQFSPTTWEGITLGDNAPQGYSAFGSWDTVTQGKSFLWSAATDAQKAMYRNHPDCNSYLDDDGFIIVLDYRFRVVEGFGNSWNNLLPSSTGALSFASSGLSQYVASQGSATTLAADLVAGYTGGNEVFIGPNTVWASTSRSDSLGKGSFLATSGVSAESLNAHEGMCYAIPICMVQRGNIGSYHPVLNPEGFAMFNHTNGWGIAWYAQGNTPATSTAQCFHKATTMSDTGIPLNSNGNIVGNQSGRPSGEFYDAVYAHNVKDLRMRSSKLSHSDIRKKYSRKGIEGSVRGFDSVPFLVPKSFECLSRGVSAGFPYIFSTSDEFTSNVSGQPHGIGRVGYIVGNSGIPFQVYIVTHNEGSNDSIQLNDASISVTTEFTVGNTYILLNEIPAEFGSDNPMWTDVAGSPTNILSTFPNGIQAQWIPDTTSASVPANRKVLTAISRVYTADSGVSWTSAALSFVEISNLLSVFLATQAQRVTICSYRTQAVFTENDSNSEVLDLGDVYAVNYQGDPDHFVLTASLLGKVSTNGTGKVMSVKPVYTYGISALGLLSSDSWAEVTEHAAIDLGGSGPAVKALDYLSSTDGVAKLFYCYRELVNDAGSFIPWGDDGIFTIGNNQGTMTDLNGSTVLFGTASFKTQYFTND